MKNTAHALTARSLMILGLIVFTGSLQAETPAAVAAAATASPDAIVNVWPSEPPAWTPPSEAEKDTSDENSRQVAGKYVTRIGNVSTPQLYVYHPKADVKSDTAIVVCPGGGYSILAWDLEGTEIAEWLQEIGVTAVVLKYRVPTRSEDENWKPAVQDIQRAISMVRSGVVEGVSAKRVGVLGFSAGGNASARSATASKRYYDAIDDHDAANYVPDFAVLVYPAWLVEKDDTSTLIDDIQVTEKTPPMFFAHARDDRISCLGSVTLFTELQKHGINAALHVFGSGGHGFGSRPNDQQTDAWPELLTLWMRDLKWIK
ncbi:alpha/beta hydrolase [Novipirellula sp.]|uniref:alpha/beta hydrolase n=1 Tax=Novipirellula sp. TaxID=2795430 RepID=UPI0035619796